MDITSSHHNSRVDYDKYVTSGPILGPGWKHVESFDDSETKTKRKNGMHQHEGEERQDDEEDDDNDEDLEWESEEEEIYVTLDLGSTTDPLVIATSSDYQLVGLDTDHPYLKIGNQVFRGTPRKLMGSEIIFKDVRDPQNPIRHSHQPLTHTQLRIEFEPIKLTSKSQVPISTSTMSALDPTTNDSPRPHVNTPLKEVPATPSTEREELASRGDSLHPSGGVTPTPTPNARVSAPTFTSGSEIPEDVTMDQRGSSQKKKGRKMPSQRIKTAEDKEAIYESGAGGMDDVEEGMEGIEVGDEEVMEIEIECGNQIEGVAGPGPSTMAAQVGRTRSRATDNDSQVQQVDNNATDDPFFSSTNGAISAGLLAGIKPPKPLPARGRGSRGGRGSGTPRNPNGRPRGSRNRVPQAILDVEEAMKREAEEEEERKRLQGVRGEGLGEAGEQVDLDTGGRSLEGESPPGLQVMERSPSPPISL